ncbi:MAG: long-chain fatty acid--CoA ligase [Actinomycetaceae bacterium]|nr:long-chain fatty acid--CoA ligase [Actinomycetaceae bacterium]
MDETAPARPHYAPGVPAEIEPVTQTLDQQLPRAAADFPNRVAIDFLGRTITYGELDHQVRKATSALYRCGVRNGDVVALIMPNCPQHVVAFYAALALGATVAEHNPLAPARELHEQLDRHGAVVVIAWEQTLEKLVSDGDFRGRTYLAVDLSRELPHLSRMLLRLPLSSAREQRAKLRGEVPHGVLSFDRIVKKSPSLPRHMEMEPPELDDIAVLLHTGGTTGVPKAVQLTHRNVVSNMVQTIEWVHTMGYGTEVFAAVLPFFHAFGLSTCLGICIRQAGTLVLLPNFNVASLLAGQKRHPITLFPGVAPMFQRILDEADRQREAGEDVDLSSIRFAFSGAMALDPALAARWEEGTGGYIIEGYGMTEASPIIAGSPVTPERRPSTLGLPFPSTEIRVADPEDPSRDANDIGEVLVRGPQVFAGYLGMPEETDAVLWNGWLRTGDLARWDDGFLVMADRRKELIINGGFNIYPSQVEDAIRDMPGVRDVAVVGMPEDARGESVVAALVLEPGAMVDLDSVRRWTQDKLSHYAMPKSIAVVDELPRSQIGKVMRRAVREELNNFELKSGQWIRKAGALGENASDRFETWLGSLQEQFNATKEQVQEWLSTTSEHSTEQVRGWFAEKGVTAEELRARLQKEGLSREGFSAWLSRSGAAVSGALKSSTEAIQEKLGGSPTQHDEDQKDPLADDGVVQAEPTPGGAGGDAQYTTNAAVPDPDAANAQAAQEAGDGNPAGDDRDHM